MIIWQDFDADDSPKAKKKKAATGKGRGRQKKTVDSESEEEAEPKPKSAKKVTPKRKKPSVGSAKKGVFAAVLINMLEYFIITIMA